MAKHTNKIELLGPLCWIGYSDLGGTRLNYPSKAQKRAIVAAAQKAREIMRAARWEMDRVVFFRQKEEGYFTKTMNYHFGLDPGRSGAPTDNAVDKPFDLRTFNVKDRRTYLNKIRMGMLSISFHLQTGVYLIDSDNEHRTIRTGKAGTSEIVRHTTATDAGLVGQIKNFEEGYVSHPNSTNAFTRTNRSAATASTQSCVGPHTGLLSGLRNGEIHISFKCLEELRYSDQMVARVIIHEASHKYWATVDHWYAHQQAQYEKMTCDECVENADSYAWGAASLARGGLVKGDEWKIDPTPHAGGGTHTASKKLRT
jgi:hypothetical protein